jgi:Na+/proline symporter
VGRWAVVVWGFILGAFAGVCVWWQKGSGETLISFALGIMTFAYAGLLAVFVTALFTRRGNSASAIAALAVGFLATLVMQPVVWNAIPIASLSDMTIAWPWRFVIATALALGVSLMGRSPATSTHFRSA